MKTEHGAALELAEVAQRESCEGHETRQSQFAHRREYEDRVWGSTRVSIGGPARVLRGARDEAKSVGPQAGI